MPAIDDYMSLPEASERWGISENSIKVRLRTIRLNHDKEGHLLNGRLKYYMKQGAKHGNWIITKEIMELWYGTEPIKEP